MSYGVRGFFLTICCILFNHSSLAGVIIDRTRLIVDEGARQAEVMLVNKNAYQALVQAWVDNGEVDNDPATVESSYIVLPPVFSLGVDRLQALRVIPVGTENFVKDRETLFWLNVLEMPPQKVNDLPDPRLVITFRTQIKVIFRPKGLPYDLGEAVNKLSFNSIADGFLVRNPTPYYISFSSVVLQGNGGSISPELLMVEPFSESHLNVERSGGYDQAVVSWIDDNGYSHEQALKIQ